jgi:predicted ester cyclase
MAEDLKATARRLWEEIMPAGDEAALAELSTDDVVSYPARPGERAGIEGAKQTMRWLNAVFSDQRWEIHRVVGEGDTVVVHMTHHGRQTGNLMGIPPTGRKFAYDYVAILRFRNGKVFEHFGIRDDMSLMRQLGVMPGPPAAVAADRGTANV